VLRFKEATQLNAIWKLTFRSGVAAPMAMKAGDVSNVLQDMLANRTTSASKSVRRHVHQVKYFKTSSLLFQQNDLDCLPIDIIMIISLV
jgi:hypothetical protein